MSQKIALEKTETNDSKNIEDTLISSKEGTLEPTKASTTNIKMFKCHMCNLYTKYDYYGTRPVERHLLNRYDKDDLTDEEKKEKIKLIDSIQNKKESIVLLEKCYICDDPFAEVKSYNYLVLGANCFTCKQMACMSNECSVFYYKKRFCLKCVAQHLEDDQEEFPTELKSELVKIINKQKSTE